MDSGTGQWRAHNRFSDNPDEATRSTRARTSSTSDAAGTHSAAEVLARRKHRRRAWVRHTRKLVFGVTAQREVFQRQSLVLLQAYNHSR